MYPSAKIDRSYRNETNENYRHKRENPFTVRTRFHRDWPCLYFHLSFDVVIKIARLTLFHAAEFYIYPN